MALTLRRTTHSLFRSTALALMIATAMPVGLIAKNSSKLGRRQPQKAQSSKLIAAGKALFAANQCLDCHRVGGKGAADGVELDAIGKVRTAAFLKEQLRDPEEHVARAAEQFHREPNMMTPPNLTKEEINAIVAYLRSLSVGPSSLPKQKLHRLR